MEDYMHRSKISLVWITLLLAASAVSFAFDGAIAKPKNISGSYNCYCLMGTGSCDMIVETGRVRCGRAGSNPCEGSCRLDTTTSGISGAAAVKADSAKAKASQ
jgi:hypothetical protein